LYSYLEIHPIIEKISEKFREEIKNNGLFSEKVDEIISYTTVLLNAVLLISIGYISRLKNIFCKRTELLKNPNMSKNVTVRKLKGKVLAPGASDLSYHQETNKINGITMQETEVQVTINDLPNSEEKNKSNVKQQQIKVKKSCACYKVEAMCMNCQCVAAKMACTDACHKNKTSICNNPYNQITVIQ